MRVLNSRSENSEMWSVHDNGALGRDTMWEAPTRDVDADLASEDEDDQVGLNPKESSPVAIPTKSFPKGTRTIVQVAATDSARFALTDDGSVYGWETYYVRYSRQSCHSYLMIIGK